MSTIKDINSTVFTSFDKVTSEIPHDRIDGCLTLLQHLGQSEESVSFELGGNFRQNCSILFSPLYIQAKERDYAIGRMIRGLGASTCSSRSGFFAAFIGFLKSTPKISIQKLYDAMEKQLHVGTEINNKVCAHPHPPKDQHLIYQCFRCTQEDSDALVGHILLCGALIRSDRFLDCTTDDISKCTAILVNGSKHKKFHAALAYSFIFELMQRVSGDRTHKYHLVVHRLFL